MSSRLRRAITGIFPNIGYHSRAPQRWLKRLYADKQVIHGYLGAHDVKKLQIGAGINIRQEWLNGDIDPLGSRVIYLDATQRFPFDDNVFDYVFSEHMIEHIPYKAGRHMINECYRVLKPGGKIRICTPDLTRLLKLLRPDRSKLEQDYVAWSIDEFIPGVDSADPVFVVNNYVRDWGHQFIYDEAVLKRTLESAGFSQCTSHQLAESNDPHLRGLENVGRMPPGFLDIESMTVEAVKK